MPNCRTISQATWEHARKALVFYFSRRHGVTEAEDLAQETLAAVLTRDDYEFEKEDDFLRVCYGFAGRISKAGYRQANKHAAAELDPMMAAAEPASRGLIPQEVGLLLEEVVRIGETRLREKDWEMIRAAVEREFAATTENSAQDRNTLRVRIYRARRRLAQLTGWKR